MKIKKILIENYRAIEKIELKLNYSINPIIGVNESGKTSILKAILAFDKGRDKYIGGEHLNPQNKYSTKDTTNCRITGLIILTKKEIEELIEAAKIQTDSDDYKKLKKLNTKTEFKLIRHLHLKEPVYEYLNADLSEQTNKKVTKHLVNNLPFLLYFDDFTDRVPEIIEFPMDYAKQGKLSRGKVREWQEIIEEIFRRADTEGIDDDDKPLQRFMEIENRDRKIDILSDIEQVLDKEIIQEWKKIKKSGKPNLADDSKNLELKVENYDGNIFEFKVKDKSNESKQRTFNVNERSKGFQWFFNYMIKLKFNPRYKKNKENSIFLLDEPGSYLHSSAQSELLKELSSVSKKNTIIYCTHSQFLLNPKVIRMGSVKIVEKDKSRITLQEYGSYRAKKDTGALSPIHQALHLNFAHDVIGKVVITEGITDFYLFQLLKEHTELVKSHINFIPSSGAGSSSTLISLALPFSENFLVLFDNDEAGKNAVNIYKKEFGDDIQRYFHLYHNQEVKFRLEDHISNLDKKKLLELTGSNSIKKALAMLYYDYKHEQKEFMRKLTLETLEKLKDTTAKISHL